MENKDELNIPADFFKKFKSGAELQTFLDDLFKRGVQHILQAEMDEHLGYEKHSPDGYNTGNSRNGTGSKVIKTKRGKLTIEVPRDRNSSFEPVLVPKRTRMVDQIEDIVVSFYAKGMSTRDIRDQIKELYGLNLSESTVSNITERVLIDVEEWQQRPLDETYLIVWMDGITFKVRSNGKIISKSVYLIIGLNTAGKKEVLGMWIHETENASLWMNILTELRARGVLDILIACTDNLKGLTQAIKAVFPETVTQLCIVHQIRNSLRYVSFKDRREVVKDLRCIYAAANMEQAQQALHDFDMKWSAKYPYIIKSWLHHWDNLTVFYSYPLEIRKIIYTTNLIENMNRGVRKFTKNKTMFPDDDAVKKAVFLAIQHVSKKWNRVIYEWPRVANQFLILFPDRSKINLNL
jgi:putative transposase